MYLEKVFFYKNIKVTLASKESGVPFLSLCFVLSENLKLNYASVF